MEKVDVAVNILGKPWNTALSLLSLVDKSGDKIGKIWTQFEPVGIKYDTWNPYLIVHYLREKGFDCVAVQPDKWLAREAVGEKELESWDTRSRIRYETAFERTRAKYLLIIHNDIFVLKDLIGPMLANIGDAFSIGQVGQCWNCPASKPSVTKKVMNRAPCERERYWEFKPNADELRGLYAEARAQGIFARPYDAENFKGEFSERPWPLPECRINEWAWMINMEKARPLAVPYGDAWPQGAYRLCAGISLDIGSAFFRDLSARGLLARHMDLSPYMKHWVGTGKNTPMRYAKVEDNAKRLVEKHYPQFIAWAESKASGGNS